MNDPSVVLVWRKAVLAESRLSQFGTSVGLGLSAYMDADGTDAFPSVPRLARELKISPRSVQRGLGELKELRYVEARERPGHTTVYKATFPREGVPVAHGASAGRLYPRTSDTRTRSLDLVPNEDLSRPAGDVAREGAALVEDESREDPVRSLEAGVLAGVARRHAALETHGPLGDLLAMLPDADENTPRVLHSLFDPLGETAVRYAIRELECIGAEVERPSAYVVGIAKRLGSSERARDRYGRRLASGRDELADLAMAEEQWARIEAAALAEEQAA